MVGGGVVNCHIEKVAAEVPQTVKSSSRISSQHVQGVEYHHPMQTTYLLRLAGYE